MAEYAEIKRSERVFQSVQTLIHEREEFWHLRSAKIGLFWVTPDPVKHGRVVLGQAKRPPALWAVKTGLDFVIILSKEAWGELHDDQQRALLRHELRHCSVRTDADGTPRTTAGESVARDEAGRPSLELGQKLAYCMAVHEVACFHRDLEDGAKLPGLDLAVQLCRQLEFSFATAGDEVEAVAEKTAAEVA